MNFKKFVIISSFTFMLAPQHSDATVIDAAGNMFQDQGTGFLWHDLGQYYNMTTANVRTSLVGTGFHIATLSELTTLQAGLPITDANWLSYEAIMGANSPDRELIWGTFDDPSLGPNLVNWSYADRPLDNPNPAGWEYGTGVGDDLSFNDMGVWVVCDNNGEICTDVSGGSIPEPATLALMSLGLAGLGFRRRKQA